MELKKFDPSEYFDIFYYGFPIKKEKVKKMYNEVSKRIDKDFIFKVIDEASVLNIRTHLEYIIEDKKLLKIINDALDEMPCSVMNGFTPLEYMEEKVKESNLEKRFSAIPQNNAHLHKEEAELFYKLYFALLEYTNNKHNITPSLKKIYKQEKLNPYDLEPINEYLWNNRDIIDEFIEKNEYKFNKEELEIISSFKNAVTSKHFFIIGFEREYTKMLSEDGKVYMVKGVNCDIDEIIDPKRLPKVVGTTLLMFKGKIIYNGFFTSIEVSLGNTMSEEILKESENAIPYYHL